MTPPRPSQITIAPADARAAPTASAAAITGAVASDPPTTAIWGAIVNLAYVAAPEPSYESFSIDRACRAARSSDPQMGDLRLWIGWVHGSTMAGL